MQKRMTTYKCICYLLASEKVTIKIVFQTSKFLHSVCLPSISTLKFKIFKLNSPCWFMDKETTITAAAYLGKNKNKRNRAEYLCYSSEVLPGTQKRSIKWVTFNHPQNSVVFSSKSLFKALFCHNHCKKKSSLRPSEVWILHLCLLLLLIIFSLQPLRPVAFFFLTHAHEESCVTET